MDKSQKVILFVYAGAILFMTLFPPFLIRNATTKIPVYYGYGTVFSSQHSDVNGKKDGDFYSSIDTERVLLHFLGLSLTTGALLLALRKRKE